MSLNTGVEYSSESFLAFSEGNSGFPDSHCTEDQTQELFIVGELSLNDPDVCVLLIGHLANALMLTFTFLKCLSSALLAFLVLEQLPMLSLPFRLIKA